MDISQVAHVALVAWFAFVGAIAELRDDSCDPQQLLQVATTEHKVSEQRQRMSGESIMFQYSLILESHGIPWHPLKKIQ